MAKQYAVYWRDSFRDKRAGREEMANCHFYGNAGTMKTAKSYFRRIKKQFETGGQCEDRELYGIGVYDQWADVDSATGFIPCVYSEGMV